MCLQAERFKPYEGLENHQLLWHGTNVAVVAAILKGGLRIMPHSGGRVGKGIYFASENSKSAGYGKTFASLSDMLLMNCHCVHSPYCCQHWHNVPCSGCTW